MQDRCVCRAQHARPAPSDGRGELRQNGDPRPGHDRIAAHHLAADSAPVELRHPAE
ncbi:MAG TPA: hypothetical protein VJR89_14075 [Polyangiales bacterium]|nr:hypothetical protein [Polyangiales bacterium]